MLKKQEGKDPIDKNEAGRYFKALVGCYKPAPPPTPDEVKALTEGDGTMGEGGRVRGGLGKLPWSSTGASAAAGAGAGSELAPQPILGSGVV